MRPEAVSYSVQEAEVIRRARRLNKFKYDERGYQRSAGDYDRALHAEYLLCKDDPIYWISNYGWITNPREIDASKREFPLLLWPRQIELIQFLRDGYSKGERRLVNKGRAVGATWIAMFLVTHGLLFERNFSALLISKKEDDVDDGTPASMFGKIDYILSRQPNFLKPVAGSIRDVKLKIENKSNKSFVVGESTTSGSGRSKRHSIVVCDEWAHVDRYDQTPLKLSLTSVARSWWKISTPNGRGDEFHQDYLVAPPAFKFEFSWKGDPSKDFEWFESILKENGGPLTWDERAQEHDCSFAGVSGHRIFKISRDKHIYRREELSKEFRNSKLLVGSMDFGSGPSWTTCSFFLVDYISEEVKGKLVTTPQIYLDRCLIWQRVEVGQIGAEIVSAVRTYYNANKVWFVGDPAGTSKDSKQESWEINLNRSGVPIKCLPRVYNEAWMITETISEVQQSLDRGILKINEDDAGMMVQTAESWEWDIPPGLIIELVNKTDIKPKKDTWSHLGDGLRYGHGFIMRMQPMSAETINRAVRETPVEAGFQATEMLDSLWDWGIEN